MAEKDKIVFLPTLTIKLILMVVGKGIIFIFDIQEMLLLEEKMVMII